MGLRKRLFLIVLGVVISLGSAWGMFRFSAEMEDKVAVVVASGMIKTAEDLTRDNLRMEKLPARYLLPGAAANLNQVAGQKATQNIYPGEQILLEKISEETFGAGENERCLFIPVKNIFIKPGECVDIYLVYTPGQHPYAGVERALSKKKVVTARDSTGHEIKNGQVISAGAAETGIEVALTHEEIAAYLEKQRYAQSVIVRYGEGGEN